MISKRNDTLFFFSSYSMLKSRVDDRVFRVVHNTVKNDYIVNILLQIFVLFLYQLYLICKYSLSCNLALNVVNILLNRPRSFKMHEFDRRG